jgi:hypothetical protein
MLQCRPRNEGSFMQLTILDLRKEAEVKYSQVVLKSRENSNVLQFQAKKLIEYNDKIGKQKGMYTIPVLVSCSHKIQA